MKVTLDKIRASTASTSNGRSRTSKVLLACIYYFSHKLYSCYSELGIERWGRHRMDLICMNHKRHLVGVEIKQSIQDFRNDNKYTAYLPYCHKMYFAFPVDLYEQHKDEINQLPKDIGIMVLREYGYIQVVRNSKERDIPNINVKDIITRMAWRGGISKRITKRYKVL